MKPFQARSRHATARTDIGAIVASAARLRWRAPELTLLMADHASVTAGDAGAESVRLRAEVLAVFACNQLGRGAGAGGRAVRALRAAERSGEETTERLIRVELAACAADASAPSVGLAVLQPVFNRVPPGAPTALAAAMVTAADCLSRLGGGSDVAALLDTADELYDSSRSIEPDAVLLRRGIVHAKLAAYHRRRGDHSSAEETARAGLKLVEKLSDGELDTGQVSGSLTLELVLALLDADRAAEAVLAAQPVLQRPARPAGAPTACWLRLALVSRVHLPAGRHALARRLLGEAIADAERNQLDVVLVECRQHQAQLHERCAELGEALHSVRAAYVADRRWRDTAAELRTLLAAEFGPAPPAAELRAALADMLAKHHASAGVAAKGRTEMIRPERPGWAARSRHAATPQPVPTGATATNLAMRRPAAHAAALGEPQPVPAIEHTEPSPTPVVPLPKAQPLPALAAVSHGKADVRPPPEATRPQHPDGAASPAPDAASTDSIGNGNTSEEFGHADGAYAAHPDVEQPQVEQPAAELAEQPRLERLEVNRSSASQPHPDGSAAELSPAGQAQAEQTEHRRPVVERSPAEPSKDVLPAEQSSAEQSLAEPATAEPPVAEPSHIQQQSIDPLPTEPLVAGQLLREPLPTEPPPTEPLTTEPLVAEPLPTEPLVAEQLLGEPAPAERSAAEVAAAQPLPAEHLPAQPLPAEHLPAQPLPAEHLPAQYLPAQRPAVEPAQIEEPARRNGLPTRAVTTDTDQDEGGELGGLLATNGFDRSTGRHRSDVAMADLLAEALLAYQDGQRSRLASTTGARPEPKGEERPDKAAETSVRWVDLPRHLVWREPGGRSGLSGA